MDLGLDGKVAMVGGASSGIGLAIAEELASEGAHVAIAARGAERLAAARERVDRRGPGRVTATTLDVRDAGALGRWVEATAETLGGPNVVVSNGGGPPSGPAGAFGVDDYRAAVELCLLPAIALAEAALPHLRAAGWGRLLFVTSEAVKQPMAGYALSNTARLGILGYAKSLVRELGPGGITVNVLAPGYTRTPPLERAAGDDVEAGLADLAGRHAIPLGRVGRAEEVAAAAAFLASARASFVTGTVMLVDGGATRAH